MSMYEAFGTDKDLEKTGIYLEYETFRIKVARAGGGNKRFAKMLEAHTRPYRRAMQTETLGNDRAMELLRLAYVDSVVIDWEVKQGDGWVQGIESPGGGDLLPFTRANVLETFKKLPDLFAEVQEQAGKATLYRQMVMEEDAGN